MRTIITGGGGFLGQLLAEALAARGGDVILADLQFPPEGPGNLAPHVEWTEADITNADAMHRLIAGADAVVHMASMVSAGSEADFDAAMRVNVDGGRNVVEAARANGPHTKVLFASSLAIFGGARMPKHVDEMTRPTPQNTYGMTKVMLELLINDMSRKGMIDGRVARLPTIAVRPIKPNAAASGFVSGVIREPMRGETCELPVPRDMPLMLGGYRDCIASLVALLEADADRFGDDRVVNLPNITATVAEMIDASRHAAERHGIDLGPVVDAPDELTFRIFSAWPTSMDAARAISIGCPESASLDEIVEQFVQDYVL